MCFLGDYIEKEKKPYRLEEKFESYLKDLYPEYLSYSEVDKKYTINDGQRIWTGISVKRWYEGSEIQSLFKE